MAIGSPLDLQYRPLFPLDLEGEVRTETRLFSNPVPLNSLGRDYGVMTHVEVPDGLMISGNPAPYVSLDVVTIVQGLKFAKTYVRGATQKGVQVTKTIPSMGKQHSAAEVLPTHYQLLETLQELYRKQHPKPPQSLYFYSAEKLK